MRKISNFHTHTKLCKHATGLPLDYALQAQKEGCLALGFSDHCPYPDSFNEIWPGIRMSVEEIPFYKAEIQKAREAVDFPVYVGFECEYDPSYKSWYQDLKAEHGAQYLIMGPHWVPFENTHIGAGSLDTLELQTKYIDNMIDGMSQKLYSFVAHPDLFMTSCKKWDENSKAYSKALIQAAEEYDIPLEINGLGMYREKLDTPFGIRHPYPFLEFWEMVADSKVRVICNSDAHDPKDVIFNAWRSVDFAARVKINPIEVLSILL